MSFQEKETINFLTLTYSILSEKKEFRAALLRITNLIVQRQEKYLSYFGLKKQQSAQAVFGMYH